MYKYGGVSYLLFELPEKETKNYLYYDIWFLLISPHIITWAIVSLH